MKTAKLFIVLSSFCLSVLGESAEEVNFFTPIIFRHVLSEAAKDKRLHVPLDAKNNLYALTGQILISDLPLPAEIKKEYDDAFTLSFSLVPQITYKIYVKNKIIMRLEENDSKGNELVYIRKLGYDDLSKFPEDYAKLSYDTMMEI